MYVITQSHAASIESLNIIDKVNTVLLASREEHAAAIIYMVHTVVAMLESNDKLRTVFVSDNESWIYQGDTLRVIFQIVKINDVG